MYVLIALALLQTPSPTVQSKHPIVKQSAGSSAKNTSAKNSQTKFPPAQSQITGIPSAQQPTPDKGNEDKNLIDRIYKVDVVSPPAKPLDTPLFPVYLLLTGIGVFANLWIAFLIFRQSRLIRHQVRTNHISTRASIRSARAAQDNASTVINSERAWVIPELQSPAVDRDGKLYWREAKNVAIAEKDILAGRHLIYTLKITNMGRTPAQILSFKIFYTCLDEGVRDLSPESPVDYAASREFIRLLDTRESIEIDEPKINVHEFVNRYSGSIRKLEKTAVIHGWVKYRHMFSREKTCYADFCYVYTVSRNRLSSVGRHTGQREEIDVPEEEQN